MALDNPPVTRHTGWLACGRPSTAQVVWGGLFCGLLILSALGLKHLDLPAIARYLFPLVTTAVGVAYVRSTLADIRRQSDELQLRIYLEATAITVHGLFIALLVYPVFEKAGLVGPIDYSVVLFLLIGLSIIGFAVATRRYR